MTLGKIDIRCGDCGNPMREHACPGPAHAPGSPAEVDYANEGITERAKQSALWADLEYQRGRALPYMIERYLLLENWNTNASEEVRYCHLILAHTATVLLAQEERIRKLEAAQQANKDAVGIATGEKTL